MNAGKRLGTVLICHAEEPLHLEGIARWLAQYSDLRGMVVIHDAPAVRRRRIHRELKRSGWLGFFDVLLFRAYYFMCFRHSEAAWRRTALESLQTRYAPLEPQLPRIDVVSPNSPEVAAFIQQAAPDFVLAICKHLLKPAIFTLPTLGTFVLHPGICPEYRNAHGCFWAMVNDDDQRVGMTLLRVDAGVDTGPIFGYFTYPFDARRESPLVIQYRVTLENLDAIWKRFEAVAAGTALPISTAGRRSEVWGQPRLTRYLSWRWRYWREGNARHHA